MTIWKIARSPLVHFFILGGFIFALFAVLNDEPVSSSRESIVLDKVEAQRLVDQFVSTWQREPTAQELDTMMQSWAREETFAREAIALGLDRGDAIIQRRLSQKMQFVAESAAGSLEATDEVLADYLQNNKERFARPDAFAIEQVFLPGNADDRAIARIREALRDGADPSTRGESTLLPARLPLTPAPAIDGVFGDGFHEALQSLSLERWSGPVSSSYGRHLVKVTQREEPALPSLADIRSRVEAKWRASKAKEMRESYGAALLDRYAIVLPSPDDVLDQ